MAAKSNARPRSAPQRRLQPSRQVPQRRTRTRSWPSLPARKVARRFLPPQIRWALNAYEFATWYMANNLIVPSGWTLACEVFPAGPITVTAGTIVGYSGIPACTGIGFLAPAPPVARQIWEQYLDFLNRPVIYKHYYRALPEPWKKPSIIPATDRINEVAFEWPGIKPLRVSPPQENPNHERYIAPRRRTPFDPVRIKEPKRQRSKPGNANDPSDIRYDDDDMPYYVRLPRKFLSPRTPLPKWYKPGGGGTRPSNPGAYVVQPDRVADPVLTPQVITAPNVTPPTSFPGFAPPGTATPRSLSEVVLIGKIGKFSPTRPARYSKEVKLGAAFTRFFEIMNFISESAEVVDAFFSALPKPIQGYYRTQYERKKGFGLDNAGQFGIEGADWKLLALYQNFYKVDFASAIANVVANQVEDAIIGRLAGELGKVYPRAVPVSSKAAGQKIAQAVAYAQKQAQIWASR